MVGDPRSLTSTPRLSKGCPWLLAAAPRLFEEFDRRGDVLPAFDLIFDLHHPAFSEIGLKCQTLRDTHDSAIAQLYQLAVHIDDPALPLMLALVDGRLREDEPTRAGTEGSGQRGHCRQRAPHPVLSPVFPRGGGP